MIREEINDIMDSRQSDFERISDKVWEFAETSFLEIRSAKIQADYMEKRGFEIIMPAAGMESGLVAHWGTEEPVILPNFLSEVRPFTQDS